MEIRQLNLEEYEDMGEIPVEAKEKEENDDSNNRGGGSKTLKYDAFFLDQNGNEVESSTRFDPGLDFDENEQPYSRFGRSQGAGNYWEKRDYMANSSFKTSLSAKSSRDFGRGSSRGRGGRDGAAGNYRENFNRNKPGNC